MSPKDCEFECQTPSATERPAPSYAEPTFGRGLENHVSLGSSSSGPNNEERSQGIYFREDHSRHTRCPNLLAENRQAPFGAKRPRTRYMRRSLPTPARAVQAGRRTWPVSPRRGLSAGNTFLSSGDEVTRLFLNMCTRRDSVGQDNSRLPGMCKSFDSLGYRQLQS